MSDNKILLTLAALIGTYIAISKFTNDSIQENFTGHHQFTTKLMSTQPGTTSHEASYNAFDDKVFVTANRQQYIQRRTNNSPGLARVYGRVDYEKLATEEVHDLEEEVHDLENELHNSDDVFVASHLIYANKKSRQQAQGCPFRGDIPCPPCPIISKPSASHHDLRQGAFGVTTDSGLKNTHTKLAELNGSNTAYGADLNNQTVAFH